MYQSAKSYRQAIDSRIKKAAETGGVHPSSLRKKVAFNAFLAAVKAAEVPLFLKGGYLMELRSGINARSTKDLDFVAKSSGAPGSDQDARRTILQILEGVCSSDGVAYFEFIVKNVKKEIGYHSDRQGLRISISVNLDGRVFESFYIDVVFNDVLINPETLTLPDLLSLGEQMIAQGISKEQHFAEKIRAYAESSNNFANSRVKDLVDLYLLAKYGRLDETKAQSMLTSVFEKSTLRKPPDELARYPSNWLVPFNRMMKDLGESASLAVAFLKVKKQYLSILEMK